MTPHSAACVHPVLLKGSAHTPWWETKPKGPPPLSGWQPQAPSSENSSPEYSQVHRAPGDSCQRGQAQCDLWGPVLDKEQRSWHLFALGSEVAT